MARQMTDSHRRFLQTMMSNGVMESSKANALYLHFCRDQSVPAQLDEFIGVINTELQPMFMHIRKGMCEDDGHQYYALPPCRECTVRSRMVCERVLERVRHSKLRKSFQSLVFQVNMAETDITRMSSDYADNELELFRKTMDLIVDSERGRASSTDILNCADRLQTKKMKKKEVENLLDRLVQDKWLNEKRGEYTLSTRCIIEMEPYIRNIYQDLVKPCAICHSLAFQSQTCENCGIRIHLPCAAKFFKNNTEPRCPSCKDYWLHEIPVFQSQTLSQSASSRASTAPASTASRRHRK